MALWRPGWSTALIAIRQWSDAVNFLQDACCEI